MFYNTLGPGFTTRDDALGMNANIVSIHIARSTLCGYVLQKRLSLKNKRV